MEARATRDQALLHAVAGGGIPHRAAGAPGAALRRGLAPDALHGVARVAGLARGAALRVRTTWWRGEAAIADPAELRSRGHRLRGPPTDGAGGWSVPQPTRSTRLEPASCDPEP